MSDEAKVTAADKQAALEKAKAFVEEYRERVIAGIVAAIKKARAE